MGVGAAGFYIEGRHRASPILFFVRASGKTLASSLRADTRATAERGSKLGLRATAAERGVSKLGLGLPQLKRLWVALELPQLKEGCD